MLRSRLLMAHMDRDEVRADAHEAAMVDGVADAAPEFFICSRCHKRISKGSNAWEVTRYGFICRRTALQAHEGRYACSLPQPEWVKRAEERRMAAKDFTEYEF